MIQLKGITESDVLGKLVKNYKWKYTGSRKV
jgi:hypothetical protein